MRSYPLNRRFLVGVGLTVYLALVTGCQTATPPPSEIIAHSVSEFSDVQGTHGWSYGYWDRSLDVDTNYDQVTDFRLLEHFGYDRINGLSSRSEFTTGPLWYLRDGQYYTSLWAEGGHANTTLKLGKHAQVEQWAVRRWVSTREGTVLIGGHVGKVMPWGANWSGGVLALVVVDNEELFRAEIGIRDSSYAITAKVERGSSVDFLIGPNPSVGVIEFTATIRTVPTLSQ